MDGSWFLARNPGWIMRDTDPSDWLNLKCSESISLHLLAVARTRRKTVLSVTWSLEALCKGSYGAFCRQIKTQDKFHLGVRDLCTGRCNSKDLITFDKTGLDPILLPVLNLRILEITDLYPLIVLIWYFFSEKRKIRKSAITVRGAETGLTFFLWYQRV